MFKVLLASLDTLVTKWLVTQKWLVVERNGVKFGTRGASKRYNIPKTFDLVVFNDIWGSFGNKAKRYKKL